MNLSLLRLGACEFLNDDCFKSICCNSKNLEELDISSCINIKDFTPLALLNKLKRLILYRTEISKLPLKSFIS